MSLAAIDGTGVSRPSDPNLTDNGGDEKRKFSSAWFGSDNPFSKTSTNDRPPSFVKGNDRPPSFVNVDAVEKGSGSSTSREIGDGDEIQQIISHPASRYSARARARVDDEDMEYADFLTSMK